MSAHQDFARETWHLNAFNMCEVIVIREGADARGHRYIDGRHQVRVHLYENVQAAANAVRQHNAALSAVAETRRAMTAVSDEAGRDAYLPFDAPLWQQYEHRIKWLMARIGMPDSVSLAEAMKQLLNDAEYIRTNRTPAAALSAAPVAQEPVARDNERFKRFSNDEVATIPDGYRSPLSIKTSTELIAEQEARAVTPPATPAGTPANRGDRVIYWLKRYQADEHLDDDACEELDALINVLSKGVKVQPSAGVGADEIARVFARWKNSKNLHESLAAQNIEKELLALLSRAGDQSNSTQKDGSR